MNSVLPEIQIPMQQEILNEGGHQTWRRVTVHDFGDNNVEFSLMPYETWGEFSEDDIRPRSKRGEGDRVRSAEVAAKRARRKVRHLCKLLKARYMVTLTTREIITDIDQFQKLFQEFVRRIRKAGDFQYVATHELQERGALHLHIAVPNRLDCKLLWSIWRSIVGVDNGRVHISSPKSKMTKASATNRIANYISKYIAKSFETGELNRRRYWASKNIAKVIRTIHLLRPDWSHVEVLLYIKELCEELNVEFRFDHTWCNFDKGLFWMAATG
jgi:hypothetical protein